MNTGAIHPYTPQEEHLIPAVAPESLIVPRHIATADEYVWLVATLIPAHQVENAESAQLVQLGDRWTAKHQCESVHFPRVSAGCPVMNTGPMMPHADSLQTGAFLTIDVN